MNSNTYGSILFSCCLVFFIYYTFWVIISPFYPPLSNLFPAVRYALIIPVILGTLFIGSLVIYTVIALSPLIMQNNDPWMAKEIHERFNLTSDDGTSRNGFEDNFHRGSTHLNCKLPDSKEYLASLEKKLAGIKRGKGNTKTEGKELIKSLEESNNSCMYRLIASDTYSQTERDLLLDAPTKLTLSRKWANPEQALTVGELVELVKADYLAHDTATEEDSSSETMS